MTAPEGAGAAGNAAANGALGCYARTVFRRSKADAQAARATRVRGAPGAPARPVERYLAALRQRALVQGAARALVLGLGAGALVVTVAARLTGPVASWPFALAAWATTAVALGIVGAWALRGLRGVSGAGAARLLAPAHAELASAARSAVEFAGDADTVARAPGLVAAHAARVRESLAEVTPASVLPWRALLSRPLGAAVLATLLCGAFAYADPQTLAGAWALSHPASSDPEGNALAAIVASCDARLIYPAYLGVASTSVHDVTDLAVPVGTTVELTVWPRVHATSGTVEVAGRPARLARATGGGLTGRFVVREGGTLVLRVQEGQRWLRDPRVRTLRAVRDEPPRVAITEPSEDRAIEADAEIPIFWSAKDDVALSEVELVLKTADGREVRRRLDTFATDERRLGASGTATIVASALGAQPGDRIVLRVDARDGDVVSGPNVGRSPERTLTVASDATRHAENVAGLKDALDLALATLADRLESPLPDAESEARARYAELSPRTSLLASAVEEVALTLRGDASARRSDASALEAVSDRLRRSAAEEDRLHPTRLAPLPKRMEHEVALVAELEKDTLLLEDMLGRARLEDAAAITRELEQIRQRMTSLLAELRRNPDEQTRRSLLAEVARAELRMRELAERLARMGTDVPSDFANQDALPTNEAQSSLEGLREALESNDLDEATRRLDALARDLERMASALGSAQDGFTESRFGPREQAMAEAMDAVAGLEAEQRDLAQRSSETRRRAAERAAAGADGEAGEATRRLAERAGTTRRALDRLDRSRLNPGSQETLDRARQRARDVEDALRSGDLSEASRMAMEAEREADDLASSLGIEAEMFGGTDGQNGQRARTARDATRGLAELSRDIDEATPRVSDFVDDGDRAAMRGDAPRQRHVRDAAGQLEQRFANGPDGTPLSPEGEQAVREAAQQMEQAEQALGRGDPREAARAQDEAARKLAELREQMEQEQQSGGGGGSGSGGGGGGDESGRAFHEPVHIPGAEEFAGPAARRRQVLDAMRDRAPAGWEDAVRRYYEGLLR